MASADSSGGSRSRRRRPAAPTWSRRARSIASTPTVSSTSTPTGAGHLRSRRPAKPAPHLAPARLRLSDRDVRRRQHGLRPGQGRALLTQVEGKLEFQRHNTSQLVTIDISDPGAAQDPAALRHRRRAARGRVAQDRQHHLRGLLPAERLCLGLGLGGARPAADGHGLGLLLRRERPRAGQSRSPSCSSSRAAYQLPQPNERLPPRTELHRRGHLRHLQRADGRRELVRTAPTCPAASYGCGAYESYQQLAALSHRHLRSVRRHPRPHPVRAARRARRSVQADLPRRRGRPARPPTSASSRATSGASGGCSSGQRVVQNYLVAVDVTTARNPRELGQVAFGKPNETVRGSVFDTGRQVAFAITAQQHGPALRAQLRRSRPTSRCSRQIDGL